MVRFGLAVMDAFLSLFFFRKNKFPTNIKRILIIKPDHLGDVLLLTSVLPLMAQKYPDISIDIVCGSWANELLRTNKHIRNIYNVDHFWLNRSKKSFIKKLSIFIKNYFNVLIKLRANHYDLCLLMRPYIGNLITLGKLSGSAYLIGHETVGFGPLCDKVVAWQEGKHEVEHFLEILQPLDITHVNVKELRTELYCEQTDIDYVDKLMLQNALQRKKFIIIHPGAGVKEKCLSIDVWLKLIQKLNGDTVICGTAQEKEYFNFFATHYTGTNRLIDLTNQLSLSQLYILFSRAETIFTLDSLAAHVGAMSGSQIVGFYFYQPYSDPIEQNNYLMQWRPLAKHVHILNSLPEIDNFIERMPLALYNCSQSG